MKKLHSWPLPLKGGEIIDVIAPAYGNKPQVVENLKDLAKAWGIYARIPENLFGKDLFCANSDEERFQSLKEALYKEDSSYIWAVQGGYGSGRLLSMLKDLSPPSKPKLLIGFSDITALHIFLNHCWGWPSLHGPNIKQVVMKEVCPESILQLKNILFDAQKDPTVHSLIPFNEKALEETLIKAPLVGGNLCLVQTSLGTFWQLEGKDKILFLEEVDEQGYRVDRSLVHLMQAGVFSKVKAVLLGDFMGRKEKDDHLEIQETLARFSKSLPIPAFRVQGIGHGVVNYPLPFGPVITLKTGPKAELAYQV